jgi:hypothetical protein
MGFVTPMVRDTTQADPDDLAALDRKIKATVKQLQRLIDERDQLTAAYVLRPLQVDEII